MSAETVKRNPLTKTRKTDKKMIAELAAGKPLTQAQIGKLANLSQNRVSEILQEVKTNQEFQQFTENKDKVFENLQYRLINLADDNLLKTMLSKRGFTDAAILQDKIQVLRGQATEIHDVQIRALIASIQPTKISNDDSGDAK